MAFPRVHSYAEPVRSIIEVDDQFDSYTDTATLESRQYETYLHEMGKKQEEILHFLPEGQSGRGDVAGIIVSPGTRDPLGAVYALRGVDWGRTPEFRAPVYDGHDVYEMRARLEVPSGNGGSGGREFFRLENFDSLVSARQGSGRNEFFGVARKRYGANTRSNEGRVAVGKPASGIDSRQSIAGSERLVNFLGRPSHRAENRSARTSPRASRTRFRSAFFRLARFRDERRGNRAIDGSRCLRA